MSLYRYELSRSFELPIFRVGHGLPTKRIAAPSRFGPCLFVMLNPSTATELVGDPTIRRCMRFAKFWGHSGILVGNLFALRATDPSVLWSYGDGPLGSEDPVGPENDRRLRAMARKAARVVVAWGGNRAATRHPSSPDRAEAVLDLLRYSIRSGQAARRKDPQALWCLGTTKDGAPRHPLYVRSSTKPAKFQP